MMAQGHHFPLMAAHLSGLRLFDETPGERLP